jgi:NitT/TauT family transport system permease protein
MLPSLTATMKKRLINIISAASVCCALLVFWRLSIFIFSLPPYLLPSPISVIQAVIQRFPSLLVSLEITSLAAGGGWLASIVIGILVAIIFAQSNWIRRMFFPYTLLLQTVPIVAVAPLILMWVGAGTFAVGVIAFIICLPPVIANTTQGLISTDKNLVSLFLMHNSFGNGFIPALRYRLQLLWKLQLPSSMPALFVGIRISSGIAVIGAIVGELFAGSSRVGVGGLGYAITYANAQLQTDYLFALVFFASGLGFAFFFLASFLEWYFLHNWHESALSPEED